MKSKRQVLWMLVGVLVLGLTGCIWLRLLEFKNQLADFDKYVKVEDQHGLTLHFVKPVVLADDIQELANIVPTTKTTNHNHVTWLWTFEKQFAATNAQDPTKDLTFVMGFTGGKLDALTFPERALAVLPKPLILGMFRSLGGAEIDQKKKSATVKWQGGSSKDFVPMTKSQMTELLGEPYSVTDALTNYTCIYRYSLKTVSQVPPNDKWVRARFTFDKDNDTTTRLYANFAGLHFTIDFDPPSKPGSP
jgi:hypothetical protein